MSRSEHGNARDKHDRKDVARKQRIKRLIVAERQRPERALPPVTSAAIPITVIDAGPRVHYPASIDDLRGVMARLPAGTLNGVAAIELAVFDPFEELWETLPGVYAPAVLGTFHPKDASIRLYAYQYEPSIAERSIVEIYLRLCMLATLVHELGHHHDYATRKARGRWRADNSEARESFAVGIEREWVRTYVVPFLEDTYPAEIEALRCWILQHGGVALPLDMLLNIDDAPVLLYLPFEGLLGDVMRGETAASAKVDFAFNLHYGYHFDLALNVLDQVLAVEPDHVDALRWRAHVLEHLAAY